MDTDAILEELERLATSEQFSRSKRLLRFLRFTAERALEGKGDSLSEYLIGREVYDRAENFDPLTDGIVRVEAHRLRGKLRDYYRSAGRQNPVLVEYPVGSYVPVFRRWAPEFLPPTGRMADIIRAYDWSESPLGPMVNWPRELRSALSLCLQMKLPALVCWAPDFTVLYNDAMHAFLDAEGSCRIGQPAVEIDPENGAALRLAIDSVFGTRESVLWDKKLWLSERGGSLRENYFTTSFNPVLDANGAVGGVLIVAVEETGPVLYQRRSQTLADLANAPQPEGDGEACREAARILEGNPYDIPFASIYLFDSGKTRADFYAGAGIQAGTGVSQASISLDSNHLLASAIVATRPEILSVGRQLGPLPSGAWEHPPRDVAVLPLRAAKEREPKGAILVGLNLFRPVDSEYRAFLEGVATLVSALILRARTHNREKKLTAEFERQKRIWASFVDFADEEFRTPLTLTLGLLEQALGDRRAGTPETANLAAIRRGALQLWNTAETLIDLIRVQTSRLEPVFEPVNLSEVTEEIANAFAAELARPNLRFSLECPPLGEPAYVDRRMWDRLILSLLVSAAQRTGNGEIGISIRKIGAWIDTVIWDTGASIPENQQPGFFDSFATGGLPRRVGAGLTLARHFAGRHGGRVTVESESGKGSKFIVSIPRGRSHLEADRIVENREDVRDSLTARLACTEDAARWMLQPQWEVPAGNPARDTIQDAGSDAAWTTRHLVNGRRRRRILLAVSDRDLRQYLASAVSDLYTVETASDGKAALEILRQSHPDLLLADADLRVVDGLSLVRTVRADSVLGSLPAILISQRSSGEDRLAAFAAGASDYLVKPFSASELLARLEAQAALAETNKRAGERNAVFQDDTQLSLLRAVVDQLPIGVAIADRASREIVLKNRKVLELFGSQANSIRGLDDIPETFGARPDGTPLRRSDCALTRAVEYGEIVNDETMVYQLGREHPVRLAVSASPIRGITGAHIGAVVLYRPLAD